MSVTDEALTYLRDTLPASCPVYDGVSEIPNEPTLPYVVVYSSEAMRTDRMCQMPSYELVHLRIITAGSAASQIRAVRNIVKTLASQRLSGALVKHEYSNPAAPSDGLPTPVLSAYDQFAVRPQL